MPSSTLIFEAILTSSCDNTYHYLAEYIERCVKVPTLLVRGEDIEDFSTSPADIGIIGAPYYLGLLRQSPRPVEAIAAPLALDAQELNLPFFDIVVRQDSPYQQVDDLYRCIWACHNQPVTLSEDELEKLDLPEISARQVKEAPSQAQALRMVINREADATSIDSFLLNLVIHNSPDMTAKIRSLGSYSLSTTPIVVIGRHVPRHLKQCIQDALLSAHRHPFLAPHLRDAQIARFLPLTHIYNRSEHCWEREVVYAQPSQDYKQPETRARLVR
ncbi:hypothetical protein KSC_009660 [Ktedonobacter sp. SOSP1-52]|uniref:PhnD/SsuA/transferrin family substrate-binding protein n=1 Tax=Ktedonobacter sp. SOSP1-52 TaxID=2778366 RepID=UPI0019155D3B|nr:PhnD/SsuA/transferrin family substrate-binding protein [Ktedonobacter sp. SOSP1-52]GHO62074.1 hypothetical protein KSC_009660 [Ktedonobacter sp. SOSP1-52]